MPNRQEKSSPFRSAGGLVLCALVYATGAQAEGTPIAGLVPDRRPVAAPTTSEFAKDAAWYAQALHGVERPYPASLRFLEDQGAWFTPFSRPGTTGPYDIRRWHALQGVGTGSK